ncbi:transposase family protein [Aneurinibacillus migulanus]|uniref:HTH IS21-type domain-containing protein n=1 Tax=Aneurinibacillus migulanus TaxID=47500 RepID=A0A1G9AC21_ANEMI|nr:transposase family protein [Aneurinibacillus migulanus]MED0896634.1 hypothetical protein [Aneurinibacillus migulanus]MED1616013.1 hypothetical protein [Aneurinibacillus migulanus]GED15981.1 hypothetical protein AMI01nite_39720 [Aneurinibacillus migulanus]SDK24866.1 hypothetical protein SAMN04487909_14533 [Aneurinibacillus migulanus]
MTILSTLFPSYWHMKKTTHKDKQIFLELVSKKRMSNCPMCGTPSSRIHSQYVRSTKDLPLTGYTVHFPLIVPKFFCDYVGCRRKIFTERQKEKWELILRVQAMRQKGLSISFISKQTKLDPKTLRKYLKLKEPPIRQRRRRENVLTPYKQTTQHLCCKGKTITEIFETIKQEGYRGSITILSDYVACFRRNIK